MTSSVSVPSKGEAGFTLIELLVVILIIGILAAIGIPALLSQRDKAKNSAAKSAVRTALTAAKTLYTEDDDYRGVSVTGLNRVEPTLYVGTPVEPVDALGPRDEAEPKDIWIGNGISGNNPVTGGEAVVLCSVSKGNSIACVYDNQEDGVTQFREFVQGKDDVGTSGQSLADIDGSGTGTGPATAINVNKESF